jgi:small GTP-binding protein
MTNHVDLMSGPLTAMRESIVDLLADVSNTLSEIGDTSSTDRKHLQDVVNDLREMFYLVVIIGEFNAGKSTFVNALLGANVLPMGITPTTEVIELIRYSETPDLKPKLQEDGSLRVWSHPSTGAPGVAIVDTPGTGSVFQQHERIAKDFLHRSDLVIFVLSAKRAFAETERIYMEMAKNYGKKVILVVNQVDLLDGEEQKTVRRFIEQQVKESLGITPLIFMVSAKQSLQSRIDGGEEHGGVDAVRAHLRSLLASAPPTKQKLLAQLETGRKTIIQYHDHAKQRADLVRADTAKVREVEGELKAQSLGLDGQLKSARADVDAVLNGMRTRGLDFLENNLSMRKLGRSVSRDKLQVEFQDVVVGRALRDINSATNSYINAVVDQSRIYWRSVIERLNKLVELLEQEEITGLDANVYAEQREGLEEAIRIAEAELKHYSSGSLVNEFEREFSVSMSGFTTWSLAGLSGTLIALLASIGTPGPLIGIGAAPLALPAFLIAAPVAALGGVYALRYYRRINKELKDDFNTKMDKLTDAYHTALDDLTGKERNRLVQYGNQVLTPIFSRLEVLAKRYEEQQTKFETYKKRAETLQTAIEQL